MLLGLFSLVALVVVWQKGRLAEANRAPIPYRKKPTLLSPAERSFYGALQRVAGEAYRVQVKVRLADLIQPASGLSRSDWRRAFNRIAQKHVDFVLVKPSTFEVVCAIELDDASHAQEERKRRGGFVEEALRSAGLPLIRVPAKSGYTLQEVRAWLGWEA